MPRSPKGKVPNRGRKSPKKKATASKRSKKGKVDVLFPHLNYWNLFYINNVPPGMLVACDICDKWRFVKEYLDECDVPLYFECSMWYISDGEKGNCYIPQLEDDSEFTNEKYTPGSLVWAKIQGYPWWPAMVEDDPKHLDITKLQYCKDLETKPQYHVVFFGEKVSRAWIRDNQLVPFSIKDMNGCTTMPALKKSIDDVVKAMNMKKDKQGLDLRKSIEDAVGAMKMKREVRLPTFSFAARFRKDIKKENTETTSPARNGRANQRTPRFDGRKRTTSNDKLEALAKGTRRSPRNSSAHITDSEIPFMASQEDKNSCASCWEIPQRKRTASNDKLEATPKRSRRSPRNSSAQIAESEEPFMVKEADENWEVPENNVSESSATNLNDQLTNKEIGNFATDENSNDKSGVSKAKRKFVEFEGSVPNTFILESEDSDNDDEVCSEEEKLNEEFLNIHYPPFALFKRREVVRYEDAQAEADKLFEDYLKKRSPIPLGF